MALPCPLANQFAGEGWSADSDEDPFTNTSNALPGEAGNSTLALACQHSHVPHVVAHQGWVFRVVRYKLHANEDEQKSSEHTSE